MSQILQAAESAGSSGISWPTAILILGLSTLGIGLVSVIVAGVHEFRKLRIDEAQAEGMRQLVTRYEQLAEATMDAQQRTATDVAELRSRTAAIEQILRSVE